MMMSLTLRKVLLATSIAFWASTLGVTSRIACADDAEPADSLFAPFPNSSGSMRTISLSREIDPNNPFFQNLGTNGRTCASCHVASDGWTVTPAHLQARFDATDGRDPIFRPVDGSNSPNADVSTVDLRREAYSMLLSKGLIRIGIGIPPNAEFVLEAVDDPYGHASAAELSLFRRPLPATNLAFLSTVMWDGRETFKGQSIDFDLADQANSATLGHAQGLRPLSIEQRQQIVDFETELFTAQTNDNDAGNLRAQGGLGGPEVLSNQQFFIGINDPLGQNPTGAPFTPTIFTIFDAWAGVSHGSPRSLAARRSIARGQVVFNTKPISIRGVKGLNDDLNQPVIQGTCGTCHDSPNVGDHSVRAPLDVGLTDPSRRTADLPLYTLRNTTTGETVQTSDPGRALITGKWKDIGRFKGPVLRDLAARAPYFHNGSAATLTDAVAFYETRFNLALTPGEQADLVNFLKVL